MANSLKEHNFFGFDATVVADSRGINNCRLTTMVVTFPRIVLAEFNTHRMFSRNSASSRAIPFEKIVDRVTENPFIPIAWQQEHKGMQGSKYITDKQVIFELEEYWKDAAIEAVRAANRMSWKKTTKQILNRLLEPFLWHTVIVTATEFSNFFELRCPLYQIGTGGNVYRSRKDVINSQTGFDKDILESYTILEWLQINKSHADIHISLAAEAMWDAYNESIPKELQAGEWHLPFEEEMDQKAIGDLAIKHTIPNLYIRKAISVATCARISFGNISPSTSNPDKDITMYNDLKTKRHASPFEHASKAMSEEQYYSYFRGVKEGYYHTDTPEENNVYGWCDNFKGFISERHLLDI